MDWKTKAGWACSAFLAGVLALTSSCGRADESKNEVRPPASNLIATNISSNLIATNVSSSTIETNFPLRTIGSLRFEMPIGWQALTQETPSNRVPAISVRFGPPQGLDFAVEFTAALGGKKLATLNTRAACEKALKPYLDSALERRIDVLDLKGPEISGHYFSITDKNLVDRMPAVGEYKYLIQGNAKMAQFITTFRIVSNNPSGEDRKAALEMIRNVRFIPR